MNKLNDMIATAAKLAVQNPSDGEALEWNTEAFDRAVSDWYGDIIPTTGTCLLVDVAPEGLAQRAASQGETTLICTARPLPAQAETPEHWCVSQRLPYDLRHSDAELLQRAQTASSPLALQRALAGVPDGQTWIDDASMKTVVAPFLLNTLKDPQRGMSMAELNRILAADGLFHTLVLAADEPLRAAALTCHDMDLVHFPQEHELAQLLVQAGFHGIALQPLLERPYMIVNGVELRVFALRAHTGTKGVCLEQGDAAIYLGPWSEVRDDDGHIYPRGARIAVCAKTAAVLQRPPYAGHFKILQAYDRPALEDAEVFDCSRDVLRPVAETKGRRAFGTSPQTDAACTDTDCGC